MAVFLRLVAVLVGLANLVVLAGVAVVVSAFRVGSVGWNETLLPMLATVVAGLFTSQLALKWFKRQLLAERFSDRYAILVIVVCLGGMLMGTLLTAVWSGQGLLDEPLVMFERALAAALASMLGASFGLILGLVEGLILAFPLATIFGGFREDRG